MNMPKIRHHRGLPFEQISHTDLTDMPDLDGTNSDHDARYGGSGWDTTTTLKTAQDHIADMSNPHNVTAAQVGAIADAIDAVKDTHIDWGSGPGQVDTDDIPEGATNLYYTDARVDSYGDTQWLKLDGSNANQDINLGGWGISGVAATFGNITIATDSLTSSTGSIDFGDEDLSTTGTINAGTLTDGTISFTGGAGTGLVSLTDGTASWSGSNLSGFGTIQANTSITAGTLTIAGSSITDSTGSIDFGDEDLSTTGTINAGTLQQGGTDVYIFKTISCPAGTNPVAESFADTLNLAVGGAITVTGDAATDTITISETHSTSDGTSHTYIDQDVTTSGTPTFSQVTVNTMTLATGSITDSTGSIDFGDEDLSTTGTINAGTLQQGGTDVYIFKTISCPAGTNPVAESFADTLNLAVGGAITVTGDATTDTITISETHSTSDGTSHTYIDQDVTTSGTPIFSNLTSINFVTVNTMTLGTGSITDSTGSIDFGDEDLSTTGTLSTGSITATGDGSTGITLNQGADSVGVKVNGYDDQSGKYVGMYINASGYGVISSNNDIFIGYGGNVYTICASNKSAYVILGDSAGARSFNIRDSGWNTKVSIDSDGNIDVGGSTVIDGSGYFRPISSTDAAAPNNSIYYSTTQSKLVYKDSGGGVNTLY